MAADPQLTCIEDHWQHFSRVDILPSAPQIQRDEMRRAFMAGSISATHLFASCVTHRDYEAAINRVLAEIVAWRTTWKASRTAT